MAGLLDLSMSYPRRRLRAGEVLLAEGQATSEMYVVVSGAFVVSVTEQTLAVVTSPGAVFGETSALLGSVATATVTVAPPVAEPEPSDDGAEVVVIDDPIGFMTSRPEVLLDVARTLATRLHASSAYLSDLQRQYGSQSGNLGLIDQVLAKLAFTRQDPVEPGSVRDPNPEY